MNCSKCNNTGWIIYTDIDGYETARECECVKVKQSLARLERSGLGGLLDKFTFEGFKCEKQWQKDFYNLAQKYINEKNNNWFVVLGESGCGKTRICTAICKALLDKGHELRYVSWIEISNKLKRNVNNEEVYEFIMQDLKECEVLYIDDFWKSDNETKPTPADIRLTNELLNYRHIKSMRDKFCKTIISSERLVKQIMEYDIATVGRIVENAGEYLTEICGREKNYRLRNWL